MGMFDSIRCEYPLPDSALQNEIFQTKDLGETLCRYTITQDGRLLKHRRRADPTAGKDDPSRDATIRGGEEIAYHGDIHIYTSDTSGGVVTFLVRFTHGLVEWIRPESEASIQDRPPLSIADLAEVADHLDEDRATRKAVLLRQLERLDPEVAREAIHVFDDRDDAAAFLTRPHPELGNRSPLRALAGGQRQQVLDLLGRLYHGFPV